MVSLESRLKWRLLLGGLLVGIVLAVAVPTQVRHQQVDMLDYQLEQVARALILSDTQSSMQTWDDDPAHLDVQIWDNHGTRLYRSSAQIDFGPDTKPGLSSVRSGPQADAVMLKVFTLGNPPPHHTSDAFPGPARCPKTRCRSGGVAPNPAGHAGLRRDRGRSIRKGWSQFVNWMKNSDDAMPYPWRPSACQRPLNWLGW